MLSPFLEERGKYVNVGREFSGRADSRIGFRHGFDPPLRFGQRTLPPSLLVRFEAENADDASLPFTAFLRYDEETRPSVGAFVSDPCPPPSARFRVIRFYGRARLYPGISSLSLLFPLENG